MVLETEVEAFHAKVLEDDLADRDHASLVPVALAQLLLTNTHALSSLLCRYLLGQLLGVFDELHRC